MPVARRCSGCGAALGEPTDDDLTIVCGFCGLRHDINDLTGGPVVTVVTGGARPPASATAAKIVFAIFALVLLATGVAIYLASRSAAEVTTRVQLAAETVRQRIAETKRPVPPAELATVPAMTWKDVEAPPPPGGFDAFEPVAALPWALGIARAWASDAVLTRIDVGRVSTTGVVDLSGEDSSGYRFRSPARERRWIQETDAGQKSTTATAMLMRIKGTTVSVLVDADVRKDAEAGPPVSLPLPELLTRAKTRKGFGDRPFYSGYMIHLPREGWVWYFRAPSGDSFPRARARDGRVYPY